MSLVLANTLGAKITQFPLPDWLAWPFNVIFSPVIFIFNYLLSVTGNQSLSYAFFNTVSVSVGILTVPLMFLVIDIVHEVWGKKMAKEFIYVGIVSMLFMIAITAISVWVPPAARFADQNAAFTTFFGTSIRFAIASILAFYISQMQDIFVFHYLKEKTKGRWYWLRKNISTYLGEFVDSTIFMFVAFYDPAKFPAPVVIKMILPYYIFKILFATIDLPLSYFGVWWVKKSDKALES